MNKRHSFQSKLLATLNELSLRGKWTELAIGLKYINRIITRNSIDSYWKYLFQIVYRKLPQSIETIPQFIDCLKAMNISNQNEIIYSFVYLLLSKNLFQLGSDLLQMYHLTAKYDTEEDINILVVSLNADLQYIKWKQSLNNKDLTFHQQLAEKCSFQLKLIVDNLDIADCQLQKLAEIYIHYEKFHELEELLEDYTLKHPDYLNAHKYLFDHHIEHNNTYSLDTFNKIAKLSPSDSFVLKNCQKINDSIMSIDCLFDMLDYFQWKHNEECWTNFKEILINSFNSNSIKECINENWSLRANYWIPYHFKNINKKFEKINMIKLNVAILLLGQDHSYVRLLSELYQVNIENYRHVIHKHKWLLEV